MQECPVCHTGLIADNATMCDACWKRAHDRSETNINAQVQAGQVASGARVVGVNIETLIAGLAPLPTDYRRRIRNFLLEYLGTHKHPAPFGGRGTQLAALDAWLANDQAPPYALITAEAGRGKSALLVHWTHGLAARTNVRVVFVPISVRFGTALEPVVFTALAAQLAHVYGEKVKWGNFSVQEWRGICEDYLERPPSRGAQLIVVLDGLDEAVKWQVDAGLFSRTPPSGVRVVVAARSLAGDEGDLGWRERLGWESPYLAWSLPLLPLDSDGVRDVLNAMGNPLDRVATDVDVIGELFRLTKGDPLLVRLYVEALLLTGEKVVALRPEELKSIRPGLKGYFDKWWKDQHRLWGKKNPLRERVVREVLNLLAVALGPLDRDTLLNLFPSDMDRSGHLLDDALTALARFVVGDGREQGYVLSHSRLGNYVREQRMDRMECKTVQTRILAFGRDTLDALNIGSRNPNDVPDYALRYYGAHLDDAHAPDAAVYTLISQGWIRAWEKLDPTSTGFLIDVDRAWERADAEFETTRSDSARATALAMQIRCALCHTSVASLHTNIPAVVLSQAVVTGHLEPQDALVIARHTSEDQKRANAVIALAPHLPLHLQSDAIEVARAFRDNRYRANVLSALAHHLPQEQQLLVVQEALAAAWMITDDESRAEALGALALYLPLELRPSVIEEALAAARSIHDDDSRASLVSALVPHLPPTVVQEVLTVVRAISHEEHRAEALGALAPRLLSEQPAVLQEALTTACLITRDDARLVALEQLVPSLVTLANWDGRLARKLWRLALRSLSRNPRPAFLDDLRILLPFALALVGQSETEAATEVLGAIRDAMRWWP